MKRRQFIRHVFKDAARLLLLGGLLLGVVWLPTRKTGPNENAGPCRLPASKCRGCRLLYACRHPRALSTRENAE